MNTRAKLRRILSRLGWGGAVSVISVILLFIAIASLSSDAERDRGVETKRNNVNITNSEDNKEQGITNKDAIILLNESQLRQDRIISTLNRVLCAELAERNVRIAKDGSLETVKAKVTKPCEDKVNSLK